MCINCEIVPKQNFVFTVLLVLGLLLPQPAMPQVDSSFKAHFYFDGFRGVTLTTLTDRDITFPASHRAIGLGWQFYPMLGLGWDISFSKFPTSGLNPGKIFPIGSLWMLQTGLGYRTEVGRIYTNWIGGTLLYYYYEHYMSRYEPADDMIHEWIEPEVDTGWRTNLYLEGRVGIFLGKKRYTSLTGSFMLHPGVKEHRQLEGFTNVVWGLTLGLRG